MKSDTASVRQEISSSKNVHILNLHNSKLRKELAKYFLNCNSLMETFNCIYFLYLPIAVFTPAPLACVYVTDIDRAPSGAQNIDNRKQ